MMQIDMEQVDFSKPRVIKTINDSKDHLSKCNEDAVRSQNVIGDLGSISWLGPDRSLKRERLTFCSSSPVLSSPFPSTQNQCFIEV